jgi:type II secretory pathway pseudopilin PulG
MRSSPEDLHFRWGFTLLEMTIVIMVLMVLIGTGLFVSGRYNDWKAGREAAETLRTVYSAQRTFLSDHPAKPVATITEEDIRPYLRGSLPGSPAPMPTVKALDGTQLQINVATSPPFARDSGGDRYDPSGSHTDLLWDVGP